MFDASGTGGGGLRCTTLLRWGGWTRQSNVSPLRDWGGGWTSHPDVPPLGHWGGLHKALRCTTPLAWGRAGQVTQISHPAEAFFPELGTKLSLVLLSPLLLKNATICWCTQRLTSVAEYLSNSDTISRPYLTPEMVVMFTKLLPKGLIAAGYFMDITICGTRLFLLHIVRLWRSVLGLTWP